MLGALRVVSTYRRQRYVMQKLVAGIPSDVLAFTRFAAFNAEVTPRELLGKKMQDYILRVFGNPEQFGAFRPAGDFLTVGRALSQHFLPLIAEGRIAVKPWIREVQGRNVRFSDETWEEFDAIVLGTGFELSIPFHRQWACQSAGASRRFWQSGACSIAFPKKHGTSEKHRISNFYIALTCILR
jgi:hypothetical protein